MTREDTVNRIAREVLKLPTLERRNRDSLDFHALSVWQIRAALTAAYKAGARKPREALRSMVNASNELINSIQTAGQHYDTGALDEIEPARNDLLQKTAAAEEVLKGGAS